MHCMSHFSISHSASHPPALCCSTVLPAQIESLKNKQKKLFSSLLSFFFFPPKTPHFPQCFVSQISSRDFEKSGVVWRHGKEAVGLLSDEGGNKMGWLRVVVGAVGSWGSQGESKCADSVCFPLSRMPCWSFSRA